MILLEAKFEVASTVWMNLKAYSHWWQGQFVFYLMLQPQLEHYHMLPWYPFFLFLLLSQLGAEPIPWWQWITEKKVYLFRHCHQCEQDFNTDGLDEPCGANQIARIRSSFWWVPNLRGYSYCVTPAESKQCLVNTLIDIYATHIEIKSSSLSHHVNTHPRHHCNKSCNWDDISSKKSHAYFWKFCQEMKY